MPRTPPPPPLDRPFRAKVSGYGGEYWIRSPVFRGKRGWVVQEYKNRHMRIILPIVEWEEVNQDLTNEPAAPKL